MSRYGIHRGIAGTALASVSVSVLLSVHRGAVANRRSRVSVLHADDDSFMKLNRLWAQERAPTEVSERTNLICCPALCESSELQRKRILVLCSSSIKKTSGRVRGARERPVRSGRRQFQGDSCRLPARDKVKGGRQGGSRPSTSSSSGWDAAARWQCGTALACPVSLVKEVNGSRPSETPRGIPSPQGATRSAASCPAAA